MSRSTNPFIQAWTTKPAEITLETLPQLFAHHRSVFGGATMTQGTTEGGGQGAGNQGQQNAGQGAGQGGDAGAGGGQGGGQQQPERPEGVSEAEWAALGDPGRVAISRERDARQAAERALAAARARPAAPGGAGNQGAGNQGAGNQGQQNAGQGGQQNAGQGAGNQSQVDVGAIVTQAVQAALKPFQDREDQRDADAAVSRIQTSVMDAAKDTFLDPTDALTGIDLTQVTDGNGNADPAKVETQLKDLLIRKPHLAKSPDGRRYAAGGSGAGAGGAGPNLETKVQETLGRMQAAAGLKQTTT